MSECLIQRRSRLRRWSALAGLVGIVGASLSGCGGGGGGNSGGGGGGGGGAGRAACAANTAHNDGRARWTVLVYMNAANNLQPDSLTNIAQMAKVGSDANVNIVVQWKQAGCFDCGAPSFNGTRRYFIRQHSLADQTAIQNGNTTVLDADRLADPATNVNGTSDMGSYRTLQDFVQWGARNYPADNLAVLIWDHGSGWLPTRAAKSGTRLKPRFRAVSQDDDSNHEIETWETPLALASPPQPIDMLIFDCSLEQMTEVAYEVRNSARVMVGSEESPPGAGYPYDVWLSALKASGKNPCDVGDSIISSFVQNYPNETDITQSYLDLSKMDNVAAALSAFADALRVHINDQATLIQSARQNVQQYAYPENKDLFHFANLIRTGTGVSNDLAQAAAALQAALTTGTNKVVLNNGHGSLDQANSNGLAIYLPEPGAYDTSYANLALARATHWDEFLQAMTR